MTIPSSAFTRPIDKHDAFMRGAKAMALIAKAAARLDLPETLGLVENRPMLFAGNHRSLFDMVATMAIFDKFGLSCRIMLRGDLMEKGPGAAFLHAIGCIPTSKAHREEAEADAIASLRSGQLVAMMPEGRLVPPDQWVDGVGHARPGVARIAREAGAVVIPVAFSGTEVLWPRGRMPQPRIPRPPVRLRVGPAIELSGDDDPADAARVMAAIAKLLPPTT
ncbi:MAG: lysophospholipid acyltransferase family protein [Acidimicrobiales bacterium]